MVKKYSHVFWDWNGTLLNDLEWSFNVLNRMLTRRGMEALQEISVYHKVFGFPIKEYYKKVGFDFEKEPYEKVAQEYVDLYYKDKTGGCSLSDGAKELLELLKENGIKQVVLSASKHSNLVTQIDEFHISHYFHDILGIKDIYGSSKIDIGCDYISRENVYKGILIGDTNHDFEVAKAMGVDCLLIASGHQSKERLIECGVPVFDSLMEMLESMTMIKINALGDACPLPVIKAKKGLREHSEIMIEVDNVIATENLTKLGVQLGYQVKVKQESQKVYQVYVHRKDELSKVELAKSYLKEDFEQLDPKGFAKEQPNLRNITKEQPYIVVIGSKTMGSGSDELGQTLLKMLVYSLTEQDVLPSHLLFYNEGAKLTTSQSPVLEDLVTLKEADVEILTCGACLDYFNLKEDHKVGEVTNMYHILELMTKYHVVRP